jgi:hypothetical protein
VAFFGIAASSAALAQQVPVVTPSSGAEGRSPTLEVVVEPAPGYSPSFCPSTDFNEVRISCQTPNQSPVLDGHDASLASRGAYDVMLRLGDELVWKGTMVLEGEGGNAMITQNRTDTVRCEPELPGRRTSHGVNTSFSIRLTSYQPAGRLAVAAEITRPFHDPRQLTVCGERGSGTKTIGFETQTDASVESPIVMNGDAGMTLTIALSSQ